MPAADERHRRAQRRQRRGVVGAQHQMAPVCRNHRALGLRVRHPQHEHHGPRPLRHLADDGIGQPLPAPACVAGGLALFHRQAGVEQQHAVLRPLDQAAAGLRKRRGRRAQIALQFLEDVAQRRRQRHTRRYRERQPLGLAAPVVGVLAEDDHAHAFRRRQFQRAQGPGRKDGGPGLQARLQKGQQLAPLGAGKKAVHQRLPAAGHGPIGGVSALELRRVRGICPISHQRHPKPMQGGPIFKPNRPLTPTRRALAAMFFDKPQLCQARRAQGLGVSSQNGS